MGVISVVETKEVCRFVLENGKEIVVERELDEIKYDCASDTMSAVLEYWICGEVWIPAIKRKLTEVLGITVLNFAYKLECNNEKYAQYTIYVPLDELSNINNIIKEYDNKVINAIREIITTTNKIKEAVNNI